MNISRRQARRDAMVILYQYELTGSPLDELYAGFAAENDREADAFTRETVAAVIDGAESLDAIIDRYSRNWAAQRMAPLERSILRIAVHEITETADIPVEASIDEAVTLSKRYCSREAASLINGILGKLVEDTPGDET